MLSSTAKAFNADEPDRKWDLYDGHGWTRSEFGIDVYLRRFCEITISKSKLRRFLPSEEIVSWICIDHQWPRFERKLGRSLSALFSIKFLTVFPLVKGLERRNILFSGSIALYEPAHCSFYTDDRPVFAERLLHKVHQAWIESWNLLEAVVNPVHPTPKWPVYLWIHRQANAVWEIRGDGTLAERSDLTPVDEEMVEPPPAPEEPEEPLPWEFDPQ